MFRTRTIVLGLALGLSLPAMAQAQMAHTEPNGDARDTPRAANTARSGRTMPPGRGADPEATGSVKRGSKTESKGISGLSIPGICIGCGVK